MRWLSVVLIIGCAGRDAQPPPLLYDAAASPGRSGYFAALNSGDYQALPRLIPVLAEEARAGDDVSQAVLGFAHAWRLSESRRAPEPEVVAHAALAVAAFEEAAARTPEDPRLVGFLGSFRQAHGTIENRPAQTRRGWFETAEAANRWPEWGLFTRAYALVSLEPGSRLYDRGLSFYWETLDQCAGEAVPRQRLDWRPYNDAIIATGDAFDRRACANSPVVPYNIEGFFLIFGDHYARKGDTTNAKMMYEQAVNLDDGRWPFGWLAADRLANLASLPNRFAVMPPNEQATPITDMVVYQGAASCAVCHQGPS